MPLKLLNPGPVTLTERVRAALQREDLCHREPEFAALQTGIRQALLRVYPDPDFSATLLTGSGTAAVECMVGSLVAHEALVLDNGVYGDRMATMLKIQGKVAHVARSAAWTDPMNLEQAEQLLQQHPGISHVLAVHHETTTGRLNDLAALTELCRRYARPILLDAVSSFGGEELDLTQVEACAATANKCLHGVPGISFVLARRAALERESCARSLYLDLMRQHREQEKGSSPFTQAVHVCYALDEALRELEDQGGWRERHARYLELTGLVSEGLTRLGVEPLLEPGASSCVLTSWRLPPGHSYPALHDFLKSRGFIIYAGQGGFDGRIFRVAVMGDFQLSDARRLLNAMEEHLQ